MSRIIYIVAVNDATWGIRLDPAEWRQTLDDMPPWDRFIIGEIEAGDDTTRKAHIRRTALSPHLHKDGFKALTVAFPDNLSDDMIPQWEAWKAYCTRTVRA